MQTASSRSKIAGFTLSEEKEKFNMGQRALLHHVLFMNLISYATKFQNNYDITAVSCRGTRSLKAPLCRENQLPEAVPVSIHRLLQLVIKHKLWIPEEERMKSWHADEDTDQNLRNTSNKPPSHRCGCGFFPFFLTSCQLWRSVFWHPWGSVPGDTPGWTPRCCLCPPAEQLWAAPWASPPRLTAARPAPAGRRPTILQKTRELNTCDRWETEDVTNPDSELKIKLSAALCMF